MNIIKEEEQKPRTIMGIEMMNNKSNTTNDNNRYRYYYLTDESIRNALLQYQYSGQDLSLLYKYILSPIASFCVIYCTPKTIAPNVITTIGLLCMILSYCIMWYYVPMIMAVNDDTATSEDNLSSSAFSFSSVSHESSSPPRWIFLYNAIAILLYQTLDNMDGKQARRIGASSPLGLFFDHGCDAINSVFGSTNWIIAFALSSTDTVHMFIMLFGPYALFYYSTWEEYYTGKLIMPIMNGPNEGLLGAVIVSLISYWYGPMYWHQYDWWDSIITIGSIVPTSFGIPVITIRPLRNADLFIIITAICMLQEIVIKTSTIVRKYSYTALFHLLPFITLPICTILISYKDYTILTTMPRTSIHLSSILFVEMTTDLMLVHMTKQTYPLLQQRYVLYPLILFTLCVVTNCWPSTIISTNHFLILYTTISGIYVLIKSSVLIHEMCLVLNIWCFKLGPRTRISETNSNGISNKRDN
jgi:ethanolaminephosphotransferase